MRTIKLMTAVAVLLLLAACGSEKSTPAETLEKRVVDRWQAKIDGEFEKAYQYFTSGYKKTEPVESYAARMGASKVAWSAVSYKGQDCESETLCNVQVGIKFTYKFATPGVGEMAAEQTLNEVWMNKDGVWYYLPVKKSKLK